MVVRTGFPVKKMGVFSDCREVVLLYLVISCLFDLTFPTYVFHHMNVHFLYVLWKVFYSTPQTSHVGKD